MGIRFYERRDHPLDATTAPTCVAVRKMTEGNTPTEKMFESVEWKEVMENTEPSGVGIPYATHTGVLKIGDYELECVVLNTGQRLLTEDCLRKFFGPLWDEQKLAISSKAEEGRE